MKNILQEPLSGSHKKLAANCVEDMVLFKFKIPIEDVDAAIALLKTFPGQYWTIEGVNEDN